MARRLLGATLLRLQRTDEAVVTLEPLVEETPDDATMFAMIGEAAVQSGDPQRAKRYYERMVALLPESGEALARLGNVNLRLGNLQEGIEQLEQAIKREPEQGGPGVDQALVALAARYLREKRYDDALVAANTFRENQPDHILGPTLVGIVLAGKGDFDRAIEAFEDAVKKKPGDSGAANNLATVLLTAGQTERAREVLQGLLEANPDDLPTLLKLAELEEQLKRPQEAESQLQRAMTEHPDATAPQVALARQHMRANRPEAALQVGLPALQNNPDDPPLLETVAKAQLMLKQYEEALVNLSALSLARPDLAEPPFLSASIFLRQGKEARAKQELQKALEIDPGHHASRLLLARQLIMSGDVGSARAEFVVLTAALPDDSRVAELEGALLSKEGHAGEAIGAYDRAFSLGPTSNRAIELAAAQRKGGDPEGSVNTLQEWVTANPMDDRARRILAITYTFLGRFEAASHEYGLLIEISPNSVEFLNNNAFSLGKLGKLDDGIVQGRRALALAPDNPAVKSTLGWLLVERGELDEGIGLLEAAVAAAVIDHPTTKYNLAKALARTGQQSRARRMLQELLESQTNFAERGSAQALLNTLSGE